MGEARTSEKSEARALSVPRMTALDTACEVLGTRGGQKVVAELFGCTVRALYDKREGNTTITIAETRLLARELAKVAERCSRISSNLFAEIGEPVATPSQEQIA